MVYLPQFGSRPATILLKYIGQWFRTARILKRERPETVFVMTPPVFAALPAFWYAWRHGKQVVLDAHTAAFSLPRWRWFQWLQRFCCRRAVTTLVSNEHLAEHVRSFGADATVVPDVPIVFAEREPFRRPDAFVVVAVCSFDVDEPIGAIFEAARQLPDVQFFVTGNPRKLPADLAANRPSNLTLTGYLSVPAYGGLLSGADAVMVLTTFDHTMLRGAYEAIYQGTPVITSDWQVLREAFPEGAVHVDNTGASIAAAVERIQSRPLDFRAGAARLRQRKLERWDGVRRSIIAKLVRNQVLSPRAAARV
jgi:glycosyltransferase involved in cell wall biosynthesis